MAVEVGFTLMHQPMDPFRKELPGVLLKPLHHQGLDVFVRPESTAL
jgi:hypothetical protein